MPRDQAGDGDQLDYYVSAWKACLGLIVPPPLFGVVFTLLLLSPSYNSYTNARGVALLILTVPIYLLLAMRLVWHLVFRQPALTISHAGVNLHRFWAGQGPIPWSEIAGITALRRSATGSLSVWLKDHDSMAQRRSRSGRLIAWILFRLNGRRPHYSISDIFLPIPVDRICWDIQRHFAGELQAHQITCR